jgi:peptidoglycan hydrolase-like protein with peptidoglycan-binding domain
LPFSFAPKLFQITTAGDNVVVAQDRPAPKLIEHANLFQPLPSPTVPAVAKEDSASAASSERGDAADSSQSADQSATLADEGATTDVALAAEPVASESPEHAEPEPPASQANETKEDARTHANGATQSSSSSANGDALVDDRPTAPLRILVTRQTERDRIIDVQRNLSSMGYLTSQNFDGTMGNATVTAIKAFQKAIGLPENGAFTDNLVKTVYEAAGKGEPPEGRLFVRQGFSRFLDAPVIFRKSDQPLGTHVFTAMKFAPGDMKTRWMVVSLEGDNATSALDRIEIPDEIRQSISARLTPGSSLVIGDTSINAAILPEGDDFLVLAKDAPAEAEQPKTKQASRKQANAKQAKAKQTKAAHAMANSRINNNRPPAATRYYTYDRPPRPGRFRLFSRW